MLGCANIDETEEENQGEKTYLARTTAVGLYPKGQSDQGVFDLSGNVWEWCCNNRGNLEIDGKEEWKVMRGGAWDHSASYARAASRCYGPPGNRNGDIGFRVLCCPP